MKNIRETLKMSKSTFIKQNNKKKKSFGSQIYKVLDKLMTKDLQKEQRQV